MMDGTATAPCSCTGNNFYRVTNVFIDLAHNGRSDSGNPPLTLHVCKACGKIEWFASAEDLANYFASLGARVDTVKVSAPSPYR
jgi:hypothetical protein